MIQRFRPARCILKKASPSSCRLRNYRTSLATAQASKLHRGAGFSQIAYPRILQQSAVGTTSIVIAVGVAVACAAIYSQYNSSADPRSEREGSTSQTSPLLDDNELLIDLFGMASQIPPGRPGNLTPEQEAKLREMWSMTMKLFGVASLYPPKEVLQSSPNGTTNTLSRTTTKSEDTIKKKKRFSMFRKDKDKGDKNRLDSDADSVTTPGNAAPSVNDIAASVGENDKHGQTKAFRAAMASLSPEEIRKSMWEMTKHDHPDGLLLRFLRARKWDVQAAIVMMISTMQWRLQDAKVDADIMWEGEEGMLKAANGEPDPAVSKKDGEDFMTQMRMGKSFLRGVDKDGRPMCFVRVRLHRQGEQSEASLERFTVYTIETARMFLKPPVDTATIIFDMTDFSLANMVSLSRKVPQNGNQLTHKQGLHTREIHDKVLRSKLPRISRRRSCAQSPVALLLHLGHHQRLAGSGGGIQDPFHKESFRLAAIRT